MGGYRTSTAAVTLLAAAAAAGSALAQDSGQAERTARAQQNDTPASVLGEIVVTADRREQSLQDVPISMVALGGREIEERRIENMEDVSRRVPGMDFYRLRLGRFVTTIRGFGGSARPDVGQNFKVAVFIDDVYVDRSVGMDLAYFDLDRLEVLRGPQGTLYGKNAIAGAINIHTNRPTPNREIQAALDLGNYDLVQGRIMANGPLADDLSGRIVVGANHQSGATRNLTTGSRLGGQETYMARGALRYAPGDWDITLSLNVEDNPNQFARVGHILGTTGFQIGDFVPPVFSPPDPRAVTVDVDPRNSLRVYGQSLRAVHQGEALTFTAITGAQQSRYFFTFDSDQADSAVTGLSFVHAQRQRSETFSQELRLSSTPDGAATLGGRLFWTAGLFYFNYDGVQTELEDGYIPGAVLDLPGTIPYAQFHRMDAATENLAGYGQVTYDLTERLHLTGGVRYDYEKKSARQRAEVDELAGLLFEAESYENLRRSATFDQVTFKVSLDYELTDDNMVYATYAEGFLSGGFNFGPQSEASLVPFRPETAANYEIGSKNRFLDGRLLLNVAAFNIDYTNLQVDAVNPETFLPETRNAGKAISRGVEGNLVAQLTRNLAIDAAYAYVDAHYTRYCAPATAAVDPSLKGPACLAAGGEDFAGEDLDAYSKRTLRAGARYEVPIGEWGQLTLNADYSRSSRISMTGFQQLAYQSVNASMVFEAASGRYHVGLWVRNLTDETYAVGCQSSGVTEDGAACTLNEPRMFGVSLRMRH